jgi:hypothetical protein
MTQQVIIMRESNVQQDIFNYHGPWVESKINPIFPSSKIGCKVEVLTAM